MASFNDKAQFYSALFMPLPTMLFNYPQLQHAYNVEKIATVQ
jgi:hypothetical protein